jgi:Protein of unknown function (DUF2946)
VHRRVTYQLVAVFVVLSVVLLASVALAHGHKGKKSVDESHCGICLAVHAGAHALASNVTSLQYVPEVAVAVVNTNLNTFASQQSRAASDRAPPHV